MSTGHNILGHESSGHESQDASVTMILLMMGGLAVSVAIVALLVYGIFNYLASHPLSTAPANPMVESVQVPPPPSINDHPSTELNTLHNYEDSILSTYGWTDRNKNIVRIPIDQAMQQELERGFPTRPEAVKAGAQKK